MVIPIQHNAPAGQRYNSIRDAGQKTLATYCDRYPQGCDGLSFILPIFFESNHPGNVDQPASGLSAADRQELTGLKINIRGERQEYEAYKAFYSLVRQSPTDSVLVIHGYKLDNDNGRNMKQHTIINELPTMDLSGVNMNCEHDFVVFVRYLGVVLCEVKTSASAENISRAESQLQNSERFVQQVMAAIAGPGSPPLPTAKVIIVPNEDTHSSPITKQNGCHWIYADVLGNFQAKWSDMVGELSSFAGNHGFMNQSHFEHLVQFVVGVWTMKPITKRSYAFDNTRASLSSKTTFTDTAVNKAQFATTKQGRKFTTHIATSMNDIFQKVDDLNIMYLSPEQKKLYDNYPHALIHSHAGTGKSMLIIFKIIEILETDATQTVVLIAPPPHIIRCQNIFNKHNLTTDIVTEFLYRKPLHPSQPPKPLPTCNVLIIAIKDFFEVSRETLMAYDMSQFNVFIDDLHSYYETNDDYCSYSDIGKFIARTYMSHATTGHRFWVAVDIAQGRYRITDNRRPDQLFKTCFGNTGNFNIPLVTMTNILRNTKEVTAVLDPARKMQLNYLGLKSTHVIENLSCGHNIITGERVLYDKLQQGTARKHRAPFLCDRVQALLKALIATMSPQHNFPFSTVAILFKRDYLEGNTLRRSLQAMLRREFHIGVQMIEEQLLNSSNMDVIVDHCANAHSFECPIVVYVRGEDDDAVYNVMSRARTKCLVVDVFTDKPPLPLNHYTDIVEWEEVNGLFQKL